MPLAKLYVPSDVSQDGGRMNHLFSLSVRRIKAIGSYFRRKGHVPLLRSNNKYSNVEEWNCGLESNSGPGSMYAFVCVCVALYR